MPAAFTPKGMECFQDLNRDLWVMNRKPSMLGWMLLKNYFTYENEIG